MRIVIVTMYDGQVKVLVDKGRTTRGRSYWEQQKPYLQFRT